MAYFPRNRLITDKHLNNESGVTLIELLVYMVITGMLLGASVMTFLGQNRSYNRQDEIAEIQQNIRSATHLMASEIRFAGFDPVAKGAGFISAAQNSLSFDYWEDTDGDGFYQDETTPRTIIYDLYDAYGDGSSDLGRQVGALKRPLAENIDQLRFEYLFWNTNNPGSPDWAWANDAAAIQATLGISSSNALEQIRAVKIIILGSARPSAYAGTDTTTYRPPLEGSGAGTTWTPAAGSGYKRQMSVIVQCRNIRG